MVNPFFSGGPLWQDAEHSIQITTNQDGSLTIATADGSTSFNVTAVQLQDPETVGLIQRLSVEEDSDTNLATLQAHLAGDNSEQWDEQGG